MPSSISYLYVPYEGDTALLTVPGHEIQPIPDRIEVVVLTQTPAPDCMVTQIVVYCHENSRTMYPHMPNPMLTTVFGPIVIAKRLYCLESDRTWPASITVEEAQFAVQNQTAFA